MALMFQSVSILLLAYLTDHAAISAALAGALIGIAKIYDAVTDPLMGVVSDRTRSRWGRRRPYLLIGGIVSAVSFVLLFSVAQVADQTLRVWLTGLALILYSTGYTIFNVPYLTMPAEMSDDNEARSVLMSFRIAAIAGGQILSTVVGPLVIFYFGGGVLGHAMMSYLIGGMILVASIVAFNTTRHAPVAARRDPPGTEQIIRQFRVVSKNRQFVALLAIKLSQLLGLAVQLSVLPYIVIRIMGADYKLLSQYFLVYSIVILGTQPFWVRIIKRFGKRATFLASATIVAFAGLSWLAVTPDEAISIFLLRSFAIGFGAAGLLLAGQAMLPDVMEYDYLKSGLRREGVFAGIYTMVEKLSFALGPVLAGLLLSLAGYDGSLARETAQPENVIYAIHSCAAVIPFAMLCVAIYFLTKYTLNEEQLRRMQGSHLESIQADGAR